MNLNWRLTLGLAFAAIYFSASCAQDVGDIDRTRPNKIEKAIFQNDDEWYYRQTVVDTDVQSTGLFEAYESQLRRVRWTITEGKLLAYSTIEPAEGVLEGHTDNETKRVGLVAAFPIQGHFDVQRGYSSVTGEQNNVISENAFDRNWWERKFMRVNWSKNLVSGLDGYLGRLSASSRVVPQEDGFVDPDRTRISDDYIDTVTEYEFQPDLYACYYVFGADAAVGGGCQGGPMRVRNSFMKINKTKTYEPLEYLDNEFIRDGNGKRVRSLVLQAGGHVFETECTPEAQKEDRIVWGASNGFDECSFSTFDFFGRFGYFRTERVFWDKGYGANNEASRLYYANRWNIWKTMFDEKGEVLPMDKRVPKPIVYYTNVGYPKAMVQPAADVAKGWNDIFSGAVKEAKNISLAEVKTEVDAAWGNGGAMYEIRMNGCSAPMVEKWNTSNGAAVDGDKMEVASIVDKFVESHEGTKLEDAFWAAPTDERRALCAELEYATEDRDEGKFEWQRIGDLHHSFFNWVEEQNAYWSGYGPSAADPLTGEIISGNANYASNTSSSVAAQFADLIQYQNGDLDEERFALGDHRDEYLRNVKKNMLKQRQGLTVEGKKELAQRAGAEWRHFDKGDDAPLPEFLVRKGAKKMQAEANRVAKADWLHNSSDTRMADFFNRPKVKQMVLADPNFRIMVEAQAALRFGPNFNDDQFHQAYLSLKAPNLDFDRYQRLNAFTSERNIMLPNVIEDQMMTLATYSGIADRFKGKPRQELVDYLAKKVFYSTQLHEVGHTVGLRHNFSGSYDAMNYDNDFWTIQKAVQDGKLTDEEKHAIPLAKAKTLKVGGENPEYVNQAEFRSASVMDYGADITDRFTGLGKYDRAAIYFAYARKVERFKPEVKLPEYVQNNYFVNDYKKLPFTLAGHRSLPPATEQEAAFNEGIKVLLDGREWVSIQQAMEEQRQGLMKNANDFKNTAFGASNQPWQDRTVPYNFCSDDRRGFQLGCEAGDWGSNQREVVNHKFDKYRIYQPLLRYSGGKLNKWYENLGRYYNFVNYTLRAVERPFRFYSIYQWFNLRDFLDDLRDASVDAINFYAEIIATPEPGRYCKVANFNSFWHFKDALDNSFLPARFVRDRGKCNNYIDIKRGQAQYYNYDFTDEYHFRALRAGTFIDKAVATRTLFQISSSTVNSAFFTDSRATAISYWTLFEDELYDWLRGIILGDYSTFAGVYDGKDYIPPKLVDQERFGTGGENPQKNMPRVYTTMSFNHEFNALVGAMLRFTNWQDRSIDFAQYLKVAVTNGESQPYPTDAETISFVHPVTNQIYTAAKANDGRSISFELVEYAKVLADRFKEEKVKLDVLQPGDDYRKQKEIVDFASDQMQNLISKLDTIRYVFEVLGQDSLR